MFEHGNPSFQAMTCFAQAPQVCEWMPTLPHFCNLLLSQLIYDHEGEYITNWRQEKIQIYSSKITLPPGLTFGAYFPLTSWQCIFLYGFLFGFQKKLFSGFFLKVNKDYIVSIMGKARKNYLNPLCNPKPP